MHLSWAGFVPLHAQLMGKVLAADGVFTGREGVALHDGPDTKNGVGALVGHHPVARLNTAKVPRLAHALLVAVFLGALGRSLVEGLTGQALEVTKLRPADGDDAPVLPLRPRYGVAAWGDLPVARACGFAVALWDRHLRLDVLPFGGAQLLHL